MDDAHPDTAFLLRGLAEGFRLTSLDPSTVPPAELENYKSATNEHNFSKVEKQIIAEVRAGRYQVSVEKSKLISALGAVPQKDSADVRIIHDCSRPAGFAVNDYAAPSEKQSFQTLDDALALIKPGYFMAKINLKQAYRSVRVHPAEYDVLGLKWSFSSNSEKSFTYMHDTRLPFGAKL